MSAGPFQSAKYLANDGTSIYAMKIQPETLGLTLDGTSNDEPAGAVNQRVRAKISRANGEYGVRPRKVTIKFTATPPTGYKADQTYCIPVMQPALWNAIVPQQPGTYLGVACEVVGTGSESIR